MVMRLTLVLSVDIDDNRVGGNGDYPVWAFGNGRKLVPFLLLRVIMFLANEGAIP